MPRLVEELPIEKQGGPEREPQKSENRECENTNQQVSVHRNVSFMIENVELLTYKAHGRPFRPEQCNEHSKARGCPDDRNGMEIDDEHKE